MPHLRQRYALDKIKKKLKFGPILLIQGARQVGKSFLLREIMAKKMNLKYITFDNRSTMEQFEKTPHLFLENYTEYKTLIIDEAQKSPKIFDTLKEIVDENRIPGRFILSGSTEFSLLTNIKESLTGRATRIQIFPFLLSEIKHLPLNPSKSESLFLAKPRVSLKDVLQFMENGGMPGIFAIKDEEERMVLFSDWLDLTCKRDILQIKKLNLDPDLCFKILQGIATIEFADETSLCKFTGANLKKLKNHLNGLAGLFVIHRVPAFFGSTGKNIYFLLDVSFAHFLKADVAKKIRQFIFQEQVAQRSYRGEIHSKIFFYRTGKGSFIDFIVEHAPDHISCYKIYEKESFNQLDIKILEKFQEKFQFNSVTNKNVKIDLYGIAPIKEKIKINEVTIYPIESLS